MSIRQSVPETLQRPSVRPHDARGWLLKSLHDAELKGTP
jgi:hypothetical protein